MSTSEKIILNPTAHLSVLVVLICSFRFLLDGISIVIFNHTITIGHTDPLAYATILAPILGTHGYINTRVKRSDNTTKKVTNPDE